MEPVDSERRTRGTRNRTQIPAFGHWDLDHDRVPITQYFECCARPPPPYSAAARASICPYAAYCNSGYVGDGFLNVFAAGVGEFNGLCNAVIQQHQLDYFSKEHLPRPPHCANMTRVEKVNGLRGTRRQRRRRSYSDNSRKVFDVTEALAPTDSLTEQNGAVLGSDLYDVVASDNFQYGELRNKKKKTSDGVKDEDLYKIPPELIRRSKRVSD